MWVVKLGGSLLRSRHLPAWLKLLGDEGGGEIVVVPGGGPFADQVREAQRRWRFDDAAAHDMALRAMEQFGLVLLSLESRLRPADSLDAIRSTLDDGQIAVWFPYAMVTRNPEIEASWDVTSDSLSLWLAGKLACRNLAIVKSVIPADGAYSVETLSRNGYLDRAFAKLMGGVAVQPVWLHHRQYRDFSRLLGKQQSSPRTVKAIN